MAAAAEDAILENLRTEISQRWCGRRDFGGFKDLNLTAAAKEDAILEDLRT
jgi:hypothetical protein